MQGNRLDSAYSMASVGMAGFPVGMALDIAARDSNPAPVWSLGVLGQLIRKVVAGRAAPQADGPGAADLLSPARPGTFSLWERRLIAALAATLAGDGGLLAQSRALLAQDDAVRDDAGGFMSGGDLTRAALSEAERIIGAGQARYRCPDRLKERLGDRVAAALEYAWLLILRPGHVAEDDRRRLIRHGWSTPEIAQLEAVIRLSRPRQRDADGWSIPAPETGQTGRGRPTSF